MREFRLVIYGFYFIYFNILQGQNMDVMVLGIAQDAGIPHMGCKKECCLASWNDSSAKIFVVSLALVDHKSKKWWLVEASPDIAHQIQLFNQLTQFKFSYWPDGIFITHAHIGHYSGLMYLGREAANLHNMPVYVLPKMKHFLEDNGPWNQLVQIKNIQLNELKAGESKFIASSISVTPFTVPHRDEYSETAGFNISCYGRNYLFIPDIDKWEKWEMDIRQEVRNCDVAFLDATFYEEREIPNRKISDIPHPLVPETIQWFKNEDKKDINKIKFIHLNHTNSLLRSEELRSTIRNKGFDVAEQGKWY